MQIVTLLVRLQIWLTVNAKQTSIVSPHLTDHSLRQNEYIN